MGGSSSKAKNGDFDYFMEGLEALREGRFTYSEIYFHQLLKNHPGTVFWNDLLTAAFRPSSKTLDGADSKWVEGMDGEGEKDPDTGALKCEVELPVDEGLADVMEYAWLLADIAFAYLKDGRRMSQSLALVYSHFVCVHMQLLLHFLNLYVEERSIRGDLEAEDEEIGYDEAGRPVASLAVVGPILELLECQCKYIWYSFSTNYSLLAMLMAKDSQDEEYRQAILTSAIDGCKVLEDTVWRKASENPRDPLNAIILRHIPTASRKGRTDPPNADFEDNRNLYYSNVTGPAPVGIETFLFVARNFYPGLSVLLPLSTVLPVKLFLKGITNIAPLSIVQPPNQRSAFHYISWIASGDTTVTPGQSNHLLGQLGHPATGVAHIATEENCLTCIAVFLAEAELLSASGDARRAKDIENATIDMASSLYGDDSREVQVIRSLAEDIKSSQLSFPSERDIAFMV